jgi:hypothetical protein
MDDLRTDVIATIGRYLPAEPFHLPIEHFPDEFARLKEEGTAAFAG